MSDQQQSSEQQQQQPAGLYGAVSGGGLGSSDIVKNLPKTTGGEGMTRAELEEKKRKEAENK